jgi:hypothetical protein
VVGSRTHVNGYEIAHLEVTIVPATVFVVRLLMILEAEDITLNQGVNTFRQKFRFPT